jgi:hypothetical protein
MIRMNSDDTIRGRPFSSDELVRISWVNMSSSGLNLDADDRVRIGKAEILKL